MSTDAHSGQRVSGPLNLELQEAVNCLRWVLGIEEQHAISTTKSCL